jgi:nitric oxide dioxygenase
MNPDTGAHPGLISNMMHDMKKEGDIVRVSHPMGDFFLNPKTADDEAPVVLLSAGVGLTCLMSILNTLIALHSKRPISWIHGARSTDARAFAKHIKDIRRTRDNMNIVLFNAKPTDRDVKGVDYDQVGRIDVDKLNKGRDLFLADKRTQYYVCGPTQFMMDMERVLRGNGVDTSRINMEKFGTGGVPTECEV